MKRLTYREDDGKAFSNFLRTAVVDKLADYEDAEENGMLIHLQCRVGDTVWYVDSDDDSYPIELCVTKIEIFKNVIFYRAVQTEDGTPAVFLYDDIGKTVFFTRESAEQALAKMKGV